MKKGFISFRLTKIVRHSGGAGQQSGKILKTKEGVGERRRSRVIHRPVHALHRLARVGRYGVAAVRIFAGALRLQGLQI